MADDDVADGYFDDEDAFEWMYVEDTCPLADELAETSVPDPGYAGTSWELAETFWDFDLFDYWDDLEYGDDSYWDAAGTASAGQKRKRTHRPPKRRKVGLREISGDMSVFVSMRERQKLWGRRAPAQKPMKPFALLPDWRKRCARADKTVAVKAMPAEMRQAAEANDMDTPEGERSFDAEAAEGEEGDWEDEEEEEGSAGLANIDAGALQAVLRQKLGDAGLGDMSEEAFMEAIQKMLAGGGGAEDAMGDLASSLLGQANRGQGSAVSGWLSQQGVSLDEAEDGDDADSVATAEMPESTGSSQKGKTAQMSPQDSAVDMVKNGRTSQLPLHDGSPKAAKKRLASMAAEDEELLSAKRKKVAFDVPAPQETEAVASTREPESNATDMAMGEDVLTARSPAILDESVASHGMPVSEPAGTAKPTRAAKSRAAKASTRTVNDDRAKTAAKPQAGQDKAGPMAEAPGPAKSTRKRKAEAVEDEPAPPKKQTRKAAAPTKDGARDEGKPSYARATRATRARNGK